MWSVGHDFGIDTGTSSMTEVRESVGQRMPFLCDTALPVFLDSEIVPGLCLNLCEQFWVPMIAEIKSIYFTKLYSQSKAYICIIAYVVMYFCTFIIFSTYIIIHMYISTVEEQQYSYRTSSYFMKFFTNNYQSSQHSNELYFPSTKFTDICFL